MNFVGSFFMIDILTGYFIFSGFVSDAEPESTHWFNVYYLLAGISAAAFVLLLSASLNESSVKVSETKPLVQDFIEMFKLVIALQFTGQKWDAPNRFMPK